MAELTFQNVRITGLASAVPGARQPIEGALGVSPEDLAKISAVTGVKARHIAQRSTCTSDLCAEAAEKLIARLGWERESVGLLVFVSQTPDHLLPATSCVLQGRLKLAKHCATFDINLGCSGYAHGLALVAGLMQTGGIQRALLLVGDTISKIVSPEDRSVAYLFGDAGTATALVYDPTAEPISILLGTDGQGASHLCVPAGLFRQPSSESTRTIGEGAARSAEHLYMNGAEIFNFTIREVPSLAASILKLAGWTAEDVNGWVFHQANAFMLEYLRKKLKVPADKFGLALENFGNTSSASIPLALTSLFTGTPHEPWVKGRRKLVLAGFGVGFSWGAVALTLDERTEFLDLIVVDGA